MTDTESVLAANTRRAIKEQGRSVRGLALEAGLLPDAVRNILRGLSREPAAGSLAAIARVLGISVATLKGEEPWPKPPAKPASPAPPPPPAKRAATPRLTGSLDLEEYELQPGGPVEIVDPARISLGSWRIPHEALVTVALERSALCIVRAPSKLDYLEAGDRIMVDTSSRARLSSPPGIVILHDGVGHVLAYIRRVTVRRGAQPRIQVQTGSDASSKSIVDTVDIAGRVYGRWTWM